MKTPALKHKHDQSMNYDYFMLSVDDHIDQRYLTVGAIEHRGMAIRMIIDHHKLLSSLLNRMEHGISFSSMNLNILLLSSRYD